MSNFYVPIDYSNLSEIIPEGEDIVYSSLVTIKGSSYSGSGMSTSSYISHILMTTGGIAFTIPRKRKNPELVYKAWDFVNTRETRIGKISLSSTNTIHLTRDKNLESNESFKKRKKDFGVTILPVVVNYYKKKYEEIANDPSVKPSRRRRYQKNISQNERLLSKAKKRRGLD